MFLSRLADWERMLVGVAAEKFLAFASAVLTGIPEKGKKLARVRVRPMDWRIASGIYSTTPPDVR